MSAMFERWKKYMAQGVEKMILTSPTPTIAEDLTSLQAAVNALPIQLEKWNEDDRPYQQFLQTEVSWRVDILSKLAGVDGRFYKGAWDCYRYTISLVREIDADDDLLAIGKLLADICDKIVEAVKEQNTENFYYAYYLRRASK